MYVKNADPVIPAAQQCESIATNQKGEVGFLRFPLPDTPGSGTWTGADSSAVGTHQQYEFEDLGAGIFQVYIIVTDVVGGPFTDGEVLTEVPT